MPRDLDMLPGITTNYFLNLTCAYAVLIGQLLASPSLLRKETADFKDISFAQPCLPVRHAKWPTKTEDFTVPSALDNRVIGVILSCPRPQMGRIAALPVADVPFGVAGVTRVADHKLSGVHSGSDKVGQTVGIKWLVQLSATVYCKMSIPPSSAKSSPVPALVRPSLVNVGPKAGHFLVGQIRYWGKLFTGHLASPTGWWATATGIDRGPALLYNEAA